MQEASIRGDYPEIKRLLPGIDPNFKYGNMGCSILMYIIDNMHTFNTDDVKSLIERGADVNYMTYNGWNPLMCALWGGAVEIIKVLIDAGADETVKIVWGCNSISYAEDHLPKSLYLFKTEPYKPISKVIVVIDRALISNVSTINRLHESSKDLAMYKSFYELCNL
jgi:hypothetical protein